MRTLVISFAFLLMAVPVHAATIRVDDDGVADFNNIQAAIEAAVAGDTVLVADGTYRGPGNRDLDFGGKGITVKSENGPYACTIDCEKAGRGFYFLTAEPPTAVVQGFTITNGYEYRGGGIYCTNDASPTIIGCVIVNNEASYGGAGLYLDYQTSPVITDCIIRGNRAGSRGGGLRLYYADATLTNCDISGNTVESYGGGIECDETTLTLQACSITNNAARYGAGLYSYDLELTMSNCVVAQNAAGYNGAGMRSYRSSGSITNCTFAANRTQDSYGGAIYCGSSVEYTITNCVFAQNNNRAIYEGSNNDLFLQNCLFNGNPEGDYYDRPTSDVYTGAAELNSLPEASGIVDGEPLFSFEGDHHPLLPSACIDQGSNAPAVGLPPTDKDGNPRPLWALLGRFAIADIGAYEYNIGWPSIALSTEALEFVREQFGPNPEQQLLSIRNCGGNTLKWRISEDSPWMDVVGDSGESGAEPSHVVVRVNTEGMARGVYTAALTISDPNAVNSPRRVWVTLRIKGRLYVPQDYPTIQQAIDASMDGETIEVACGTYEQSVTVDKSIELIGIGSPRLGQPTIDAKGGTNVIRIDAPACAVSGFNLTGGYRGIYVQSYGNTISNNNIAMNSEGIYLSSASGRNTLSNNIIADNTSRGIYILNSDQNTLRDNAISGSRNNFEVAGSSLADYEQDIDLSNTADGKPIYYLVGAAGTVVDSASNPACVVAVNCTDVSVSDVTISGNGVGVLFAYTTDSQIDDIVATANTRAGILLIESTNNTLAGNHVLQNDQGIVLTSSANNRLLGNIISDNRANFVCSAGSPQQYVQNIDTSNLVDGRPIYYLVGEYGAVVDGATNAGCVFAVNCAGISVRDLAMARNGAGVMFVNTSNSLIENVTVSDCTIAGINLLNSSNCSVRASRAARNYQGVLITGSNQTLLDGVTIRENSAGVYSYSSGVKMLNTVVAGNFEQGGITFSDETTGLVANCTIYGNSRAQYSYPNNGSGIYCDYNTQVTISNSIVWANQPGQIYFEGGLRGDVRDCDVQGGYEGIRNMDEDPKVTPDGHLRKGSPCIDRGGPSGIYVEHDFDGEDRIMGASVDIGADEALDTDGDGLPDFWEKEYFDPNDGVAAEPGDDADMDEHTNLAEYELYSSDPTIPCAVYYVDANRPDDSNDGLSWATAKRTIPAAIALAENSDRVVAGPGQYNGDVSVLGRQIVLEGTDPLDPDVVASTVLAGRLSFTQGEMEGCTVRGLTISSRNYCGVMCTGSSPTIADCLITGNQTWDYYQGGGITCMGGGPTIRGCTISGNGTSDRGGGLFCQDARPKLVNSIICGNVAYYSGGAHAVYAERSNVTISNCTIADSGNPDGRSPYGAAIQCIEGKLLIHNSILWDPVNTEITASNCLVVVTYSNIRGGISAIQAPWSGEGNISADPCFVRPGNWTAAPSYGGQWVSGDYHLKSEGWRWIPQASHNTHWVWDGVTSLCIDAGDPGTPVGDELAAVPSDPENEWGCNVRINMGAYGGTAIATMAPCGWSILSDLTNDGRADFTDFARSAQDRYLAGFEHPGDLNRNGTLDFGDLSLFAESWLGETPWCGRMSLLPVIITPDD
ncbi:MAG: right-handed parallel beta-helix repeat-containing protein [Phycisphaerales bacterium]|nr:MAG: right-handed parallel beta-helix repeat-containing protein [Phycisphaerales bacterium]